MFHIEKEFMVVTMIFDPTKSYELKLYMKFSRSNRFVKPRNSQGFGFTDYLRYENNHLQWYVFTYSFNVFDVFAKKILT